MKVNRKQLVEGCVLAKDIILSSSQPFMRKRTVITNELISFLEAFLIEEVFVEKKLITGELFIPDSMEKIEEEETKVKENTFYDSYIALVKEYKEMFKEWIIKKEINVFQLEKRLISLFEKVIARPDELLMIHHYSTKENYLYHHAIAVGCISAYIGYKMSLPKKDYLEVGLAGVFADAGMSQIDEKIIKKPGPLTEQEFELVKKHPIISYNRLKRIDSVSEQFLLGVLQHHEREDGSGYPLGVTGEKIHLFSQIIAVADVYHAMTSERYYRSKKSPYIVLEELWKGQFGKFRIKVVQTFVYSMLNFSIGTKVILSNGQKGTIVFYNDKNPARPMVKLDDSDEIVNLDNQSYLFIEEVEQKG